MIFLLLGINSCVQRFSFRVFPTMVDHGEATNILCIAFVAAILLAMMAYSLFWCGICVRSATLRPIDIARAPLLRYLDASGIRGFRYRTGEDDPFLVQRGGHVDMQGRLCIHLASMKFFLFFRKKSLVISLVIRVTF